MFKDFFKPSDFMFDRYSPGTWEEDAAWIANVRLKTIIESCPVVYGKGKQWDQTDGSPDSYVGCTHRARLAFIEALPKKVCPGHEPVLYSVNAVLRPEGRWPSDQNYKCKHCGVALEPVWKEKSK